MMTDVVVATSLEGLLVGCVLLLTGTVLVVVIVPVVADVVVVPLLGVLLVGCMLLLTGAVAVSGWVGLDAVDRKHIICFK